MISIMVVRNRNALVMLLILVIFIELLGEASVKGNVVFNVMHKYGGRKMAGLSTLKAHDMHRHGRYLAGLNFPVGGDGRLTGSGLYYTKLAIGTPPKDYRLHIDTGSDLMWVNCAGCDTCNATKSKLGFDMTLYDMKASSTAKEVTCGEAVCEAVINDNTCAPGNPCEYKISYFDGSVSRGNLVNDNIKFEESPSKTMDANISFGCTTSRSGKNGTSTDQVDGLIGFGRTKYSIIQQLAMSNKTRSVFSHCFDGKNGGGVFAIGELLEPQVRTMVPLMQTEMHYTMSMNSIDVSGKAIQLSKNLLGLSAGMATVLDSGATLAYLPGRVYEEVINLIMLDKSDLKRNQHQINDGFTCFEYNGDEDKDFPVVTFQFADSASLKVYPHDYLVQLAPDEWCFGWQKGDMRTKDGEEVVLLGDLALTNKLVVYDLEKQAIGWTEYDCTSSIKVKDDGSGNAVAINSTNISPRSASTRNDVNVFTFPILLIMAVRAILAII